MSLELVDELNCLPATASLAVVENGLEINSMNAIGPRVRPI